MLLYLAQGYDIIYAELLLSYALLERVHMKNIHSLSLHTRFDHVHLPPISLDKATRIVAGVAAYLIWKFQAEVDPNSMPTFQTVSTEEFPPKQVGSLAFISVLKPILKIIPWNDLPQPNPFVGNFPCISFNSGNSCNLVHIQECIICRSVFMYVLFIYYITLNIYIESYIVIYM